MKRSHVWLGLAMTLVLSARVQAQVEEAFCTGNNCVPDQFEIRFGHGTVDELATEYTGALDVGTEIQVTGILAAVTEGIQGWSYGVAHDSAVLSLVEGSVTHTGTIVDPTRGVYVGGFSSIFQGAPGFTSAVVLSLDQPITLPVGTHDCIKATYSIVGPVPAEGTLIRFVDGEVGRPGSPPVAMNITIDGKAVLPEKLIQGRIGGGGPAEEICDNGTDDDGDGAIDCDDTDCEGTAECPPDVEVCDNGTDDDGDGAVDCDDTDCEGTAECPPDVEVCDNGTDDDGDGAIDCDDTDCEGTAECPPDVEVCDNGTDDDGDGAVDCDDTDCEGTAECPPAECPDWAFYFGSTATESTVELSEGDSISMRNATDALAFSGGAKATENGGTVTYEFSGALGTDNQRLVELIITDNELISQTPVTPNTATAPGHVQSLSRGPAAADGDYFEFDVDPEVGGPGFFFGFVADLDGEENTIPATGSDGCPVNEIVTLSFQAGEGGSFQRGDADGNGRINVSDAVWIIQIAVGNFTAVYDCQEALDANDDGSVNVGDALPVLAWIFQRGEPLPDPFLVCGQDTDGDDVSCAESSPACE